MADFIKSVIMGLLIGISNIVPGLSGGTMFVILGVYKKFIDAIHDIIEIVKDEIKTVVKEKSIKTILMFIPNIIVKSFKSQYNFLIPIVVGAAAAIYLLSYWFTNLNPEQTVLRDWVFFGLILGGIYPLVKELRKGNTKKNKKVNIWVYILLGFAIVAVLFVLKMNNFVFASVQPKDLSIHMAPWLFIAGVISAISMIIPGISGSMMMIIMGLYGVLTFSIKTFSLVFIIPFGLGVVVGFLIAIKLLKYLLEKYYLQTYSTIVGFVAGSLLLINPGILPTVQGKVMCFVLFLVGLVLSVVIERYGKYCSDTMDSKKQIKKEIKELEGTIK